MTVRPYRSACALLVAVAVVAASGALAQATTTSATLTPVGSSSRSGEPGKDVFFPFTVKNALPTDQVLRIKVTTSPYDSFPDPGGEFTLPGGGTHDARIRVRIPATAPETQKTFEVVVTNTVGVVVSDPLVLNLTVIIPPAPPAPPVTPPPDFSLGTSASSVSVPAGGEATIQLFATGVTVPSGREMFVRLAARAPSGWPASSVALFTELRQLFAGVTSEVPVTIRAPAGLSPGDAYSITLTGTDIDTGLIRETVLTVVVAAAEPEPAAQGSEPVREDPAARAAPAPGATGAPATDAVADGPTPLLLVPSSATLDVAEGRFAVGRLTLTNPGAVPRAVTFTATLDPAWSLVFEGGPAATVPAGGVLDVVYSVRAPTGAASGVVTPVLFRAAEASGEVALRVVRAPFEGEAELESVAAPTAPPTTLGALVDRYGAIPVALGLGAAGAALTGGAAVATNAGLRRKLAWVAVGLYTRLTRPSLLEHPERERLFKSIEAQPGIHFHALQRELAWNTGALTYHLRVLERHQLIVSRRDGVLRRFYLVGQAPRAMPTATTPEGETVSLSGLRGQALSTIRERGPIAQHALAEELGASKQTLNYHVKNLERLGLIRVERVGRDTVLSATDTAPSAHRHSAPAAGIVLVDE